MRGPVVYSWRDGDRTFIGSLAELTLGPERLFSTLRDKPLFCRENVRTGPRGVQGAAVRAPSATREPPDPFRRGRARSASAGCSGAACASGSSTAGTGEAPAPARRRLLGRAPARAARAGAGSPRAASRACAACTARPRVVDRVQAHGARAEHDHLGLAVQARDPRRVAAQQLGREVAERADHRSARSARPGAAGTPGSSRSRSAAGSRLPGGRHLSVLADEHIAAGQADLLEQRGRAACPRARRTAGPARPRWRRVPRPRTSARRRRCPRRTPPLWRVAASSAQRTQPRACASTSLSASRRSDADRSRSPEDTAEMVIASPRVAHDGSRAIPRGSTRERRRAG